MMKLLASSLVTLIILISAENRLSPPERAIEIGPGMLLINEVMAAGSNFENEFGMAADWLEIHNPGKDDILLEADSWFISDNGPDDPDAFEVPEVLISAHGYLIIWCDGLDGEFEQIHADFAIDGDGEHLALIFRNDPHANVIVDQQKLGKQEEGRSEGRLDGQWIQLQLPSPGKENSPHWNTGVCSGRGDRINWSRSPR